MTGDAHHMTAPDPEADGAARAMALAMKDAEVEPSAVGYINAHGTSTPYNDKSETMAIKRVFGEHARKLAVSSTKSMTGHLLGAAGGIEAIATALAIHHGILPPTINYETPDPDCDLDYVPNQARKQDVEVALSNAFGFGGTNATIVLRKYRRLVDGRGRPAGRAGRPARPRLPGPGSSCGRRSPTAPSPTRSRAAATTSASPCSGTRCCRWWWPSACSRSRRRTRWAC